jgi:hypothetical protein
VAAAVLAVAVGAAAVLSGCSSPAASAPASTGTTAAVVTVPPVVVPDKAQFLNPAGGAKYFGVAVPGAPWRSSVLTQVTKDAGGVRPNMVEYFVNWKVAFDPKAVASAYSQGAFPVVTWEPWAGSKGGTKQPTYSLATIIDGKHDAYITAFAEAVKANKWPIGLRFGHEMNGHWYPWAERNGVNKPGQFVAAWKHVHDIFTKVGASNAIWIWSPNVLRGSDNVSLKSLYPGDAYVDWVGLSGYDVTEHTASQVLDPTHTAIRKFTARPMLLTETGSQPGSQKAGWTASLFPWVKSHPDVVGFVWFEYTKAQGGGTNWSFAVNPSSKAAFDKGVKTLPLAEVKAVAAQ